MKTQFLTALVPLIALTAVVAQDAPFLAPALLVDKNGGFQQVWLMAATKNAIRYRETEVSVDTKDARLGEFGSIYVFEPREYVQAMDLYQGRKYEEAKAKFAEVKERYKPIRPLDDSPSALAGFYEMECLRKLEDLDGLAAALETFIKEPLTREIHRRQLELYVMWDAVRTKSWDRVDILAKERENTRLPGSQRAQVAYCHGLALEGLERPKDALFAYEIAMTADAGASEVITRNSALRVLAIHLADPAVQNAMKVWGTPDESKNSKGYSDLTEAAAVAALYQLSLGAGAPLPDEYEVFLKYKGEAAPAPQPEAASKPTEVKKPEDK
jgi:hypothetical protein